MAISRLRLAALARSKLDALAQDNGLASNGRVGGEAFVPTTITEDDDVVVTGLAVFGSEAWTKNGIDPENGEEIGGNVLDDNFLRFAHSGEIVAPVVDIRHAGENSIPALPIEKIRRRNGVMGFGMLGIGFPDHHQVVRLVIRQRAKED